MNSLESRTKNLDPSASASGYMRSEIEYSGAYGGIVFQSLIYSFRPYRFRLVILIVIGLLARLALLGSAWAAGVWVDTLDSTRMARSFPDFVYGLNTSDFMLLILALAVLGFILNVSFRIPFTQTGALSASRLYDVVTRHTSNLPQVFFDRTPVGRIIARFSSDYGAVLRMAGGPLGELLCITMDLFLLIILISLTHIALSPLVVFTLVLNYLVYKFFRVQLRDSRRETSLRRGPSIAHFAETSQGHSTIRLFQKSSSFRNRFMHLLGEYLKTRLDAACVVQSFSFAMVASTASLLLVTGVVGLWLYSEQMLSVGEFAVAFTYVLLLSTATQQFFDYIGRFDEALTGVERLGEFLSEKPEPGSENLRAGREFLDTVERPGYAYVSKNSDQAPSKGFEALAANGHAVIVQDLSFSYSPDGPKILNDLSFSIAYGEKLGIIGRTGSGKSTFLSCLFHLYPIDRGIIAICNSLPEPLSGRREHYQIALNRELGLLPLTLYRKQMAFIAQDPVLFRGTLEDNLKSPEQIYTREQLIETLVQVGLGDWVYQLSKGTGVLNAALDSPIGEGGLNLSAGQRQLVCVARAILQQAPIIVMDEATSFVDPRAEDALLRATRELLKGRTQIVVAHRLSSLEDCDRVLWLENGCIKALGAPLEILSQFQAARRQ